MIKDVSSQVLISKIKLIFLLILKIYQDFFQMIQEERKKLFLIIQKSIEINPKDVAEYYNRGRSYFHYLLGIYQIKKNRGSTD